MSSVDLKTSIVTNTAFNVSHKGVNVLIKTLLAPLIIGYMGLDGFGVWNLLLSVTNYPRFGIGGISAAFQKYVSDSTATSDYEKASRLLTTGTVMVVVVTLLVSLPFLVFTEEILRFLNVPAEYFAAFSIAFRFLIIVIIISNSTAAYDAVIAGAHRLDVTKKIAIVWLLIESILVVALLLNGYKLLALALPYGVCEVGRVLSSVYFARRILPEVSLAPRYLSTGVVRDLVAFAGSFQLVGALEMLYLTLVPALVMRYSGASISGLYAAATRLITLASLAGEALLLPLLSGSAYVLTRGERSRYEALFTYSFNFLLFTALPLMLFVSFYGNQILWAWTGQENDLFMTSMFLLAGAGMSSLLARHHMIIYRSRGERVHDILWIVIRFGCFVGFGAVLARFYGYVGLLSGQLIGEVLGLLFMMYVMKRLFAVNYACIMRRWVGRILVIIGSVSLLWYVTAVVLWTSTGRMETLVLLVFSFTVYMLFVCACLWFGLTGEERREIRSLLPSERLKRLP
jgi:O-antigen/teichoic acid export membrane protein